MEFPRDFFSAGRAYSRVGAPVPAPLIRRSFTLNEAVQKAQLLICGLGFYKLYVNGADVTKGELAPYISNPDDILYYDTYDIVSLLHPGENVIGLMLGNGKLNNFAGGVWDFEKAPWVSAPKFALALEMEGISGERVTIAADESFLSASGPITYDDEHGGEDYDVRLEKPGWNLPGYDDTGWTACIPAERPRGKMRLCEAEPVRVAEARKPVSVTREGEGYR